MDIAQFLKLKGSAPSLIEEAAYEIIANELSSGLVKQGLWTKALADAEWDESKAKTFYVKMRHEQLLVEVNGLIQRNRNEFNGEAVPDPYQDALDAGLTHDEVKYLRKPIKAIEYLWKHRKTEAKVMEAISKKKITSVIKNGVLWVEDKPI